MRNIKSKLVVLLSVILVLGVGSCTSKGESRLSKALSAAVKEKKLSEQSKVTILEEYDQVRKKDRDKAREYVLQVINAIDMGGDSTHIDVARRSVVKTMSVDKKV